MLTKSLTSLQHPFIKYLVKLRKERFFRESEGKVLLAGEKVIKELLFQGISIETLLSTKKCSFSSSVEAISITPEIWTKVTGMATGDGVLAIAKLPSFQSVRNCRYVLVLDGIKDPGNLGTLLRTAKAFGWDGVFFTEGSCDPFNDKVIRAGKGAQFLLPMERGSFKEVVSLTKTHTVLLADMEGVDFQKAPKSSPVALVLSHEGEGARKESKAKFTQVMVPMEGGMESLNVASAGAILLRGLKEGS